MTRPLTDYEREIAILNHEANTDAELIEEFKGLVNRAKQAIERIRELHKPSTLKNGLVFCIANCEEEYPCNTIKALDGDD